MNTEIGSEPVKEHYKWLEGMLQYYSTDPKTAWLAVTLHHPVFLEGGLKEYLLPLLRKYKVDLVFVGHQHWAEYTNMDPSYEIRFPENTPKILKDCKRDKEILIVEEREHTFKKGEKLHQFLGGNGGTFLRKICPHKEQDGEVYFKNRGYNGITAVEATSEKVTISFHRDHDDVVYRINVVNN